MKFSENWLRELVDVPVGREALVQRLTMSGLEVEEVQALGTGLEGIVVAEIVAAEKHPDADKLRVCKVDIGAGEPLQIVCGAPNARAGLKAPLATVGSQVGSITIKAAKLRGVESNGMLCSARELGLDADADGLLELPAKAQPGQALADCLGLPDAAIEIGLTPNRSDCLGMHGLAREVGAEFGTRTRIPPVADIAATHDGTHPVRIEAVQDCLRYCGRIIRGLDPKAATPDWMVSRLQRAGLRRHSLLVDVTNYVMLETGQPMHAFDAGTLRGDVVVRRARAGEALTLLDEQKVDLDADFLVIADDSGPIALAGIMGGFGTRVTDATTELFLEVAHFVPASISGRARRLGLHTDASHRFERGVDPQLPVKAIERATALLLEFGGGSAGPKVDILANGPIPSSRPIELRRQRLQRVLGVSIADERVDSILAALDLCPVRTETGWRVEAPSARFDLAIEEDLIEEVARIHGYDAIPEQAPRGEIRLVAESEERIGKQRMREHLASRGYHEAVQYAFVDAGLLARWGLGEGSLALANPLSAELATMRTSLLPGLVAAADANHKRQQGRVRLFELGRSYHAGADGPVEVERIAGLASGPAHAEQWGVGARAIDFFDLKGDVESLLRLAGAAVGEFRFEADVPAWLHPGCAASLWRGEHRVGYLGALHPRLRKALDLDCEPFVFELDLAVLAARPLPAAASLSRFPSVRRDIAIVVGEDVSFAKIEACVREAVGDLLVDLVLFDRYAGPNLGKGVKSLAMGLILQDSSRTLKDQDADHCVNLAVSALATGYKAKLRG